MGFRSVFAVGLVFASIACGGRDGRPPLFSQEWQNDDGRSIGEVMGRLASKRAPARSPLAVGVSKDKGKLLGVRLGSGDASGDRWSVSHPISARPVIAGSVVVGLGGGELFAVEAASGKVLWKRAVGNAALRGAGDDGKSTVVTLAYPQGSLFAVLAVARDGSVVRQEETDKSLGVPAAIDGIAFVPWGNQYVTAFDLERGSEVGRAVLRDRVSNAWARDGELYFGELALVRWDSELPRASAGRAHRWVLPKLGISGSKGFLPNGEMALGVSANAADKSRVFARPAAEPGAWESGRVYETYFRFVTGLESREGALQWVRLFESDLIGGDATKGAMAVCEESGRVHVLAAEGGADLAGASLAEPVESCVVSLEGYAASPVGKATGNKVDQLRAALLLRSADLVSAQLWLLAELAREENESATKVLLEVAGDARIPPALLKSARDSVAQRRNGAKYMILALAQHYDYLRDVLLPPPVGAIAQALEAMKTEGAAGALAPHLLDPATPDADIRYVAGALSTLATPAEVPQLRQFFAMYRAMADTEDLAVAVGRVAYALVRVGGPEARKIVEAAGKDPATRERIRTEIAVVLAAKDAQKKGT